MAAATFETAGSIQSRRIPALSSALRVGDAMALLRSGSFDSVRWVYLLDDQGLLAGGVTIDTLLKAEPETALRAICDTSTPHVFKGLDQEQIAAKAASMGIAQIAVVDETGRFEGAVLPSTLIRVVQFEHAEDMARFTGVLRKNSEAINALEMPPAARLRDRLPWLLVGLVGSSLAALVMSSFEEEFSKNLAVAYFVPAIVYLADAIGTQTEAVAVRGLGLTKTPMWKILVQELTAGALIGGVLGALAFPAVFLALGDLRLALAVALAILAAGSAATSIGLVLPWILSRFGFDPAFGSGPVATVLQDILSLLVYFTIVALLVID